MRWWRWTSRPRLRSDSDLDRVVRTMVETHGCCPCHPDPKYDRRRDAPPLDMDDER